MKEIQEINESIQEIETKIGRIKICKAISIIGTVGFTLATAYFAKDMIQGGEIGSVFITGMSGLATVVQGLMVYNDHVNTESLKFEKRELYLKKQQLERANEQPKIIQLRRIK